MSSVVGEIVIDVTADIGPLVRQMGKAESAMGGLQGAATSMGRGLNRVGTFTTQLGQKMSIVSAAIAAVAAGAIAVTRNAAAMGDAIGDSAKAAGMSTDAFQEYRFALKEAAAMTDEEFASAAIRLNKTLGEARSGSLAAVKAFDAIGVSQAQLADSSFSTDAAMAAFIAKMEATTDPALAAAMATDLFGKAGASLGAGLSGVPGQVGSLVERARELGVVMNGDAVKAAGEFDQKMNELGAQFEAVKMKIAEVLLPVIVNQLIPALQEKVIPAVLAVVKEVGGWIEAFGKLDPAIQEVVGWIAAAFATGGPVLLAIGAVSTAIATLIASTGPVGLFIAAAGALFGAWKLWGEDIKGAIGPAVEWIGGQFDWLMGQIDAFLGKLKGMSQAVTDFFSVSQEDIKGMDFGGAEGLGFGTGSGGGLDIGGGESHSSNSFSTGQNIAYGLRDGLNAGMVEVMPEIGAAMQAVTDQAKATLGIQSPSTVFAGIGGFIGQGLAEGIASTNGIVAAAVSSMGQGAVGATNGMVTDILGGLDTLFAGSQKAGAGIALVNTMIGASEMIKAGTFGFAAAAKVVAQGMGFIKAIKGAKGGASAGVVSAGASAAPQAPVQTLNFQISNDPFGFGERITRQIANQLNEAGRNGVNLRATVGSSS